MIVYFLSDLHFFHDKENLMDRLIAHNLECWEKTHEDAGVEFE